MSLNLTQFTEDMNKIASLDDQPSMTTSALKAKFDEGGVAVKTYLNSTLLPEITSQVATDIASGVNTAKVYTDTQIAAIDLDADNIDYDNTSSGLTADNVQEAIDELNTSLGSAETTANSKTSYGDFEITTHSSGTLSNGNGGYATKTISITKAGYYPIAIVGFKSSGKKIISGGGSINLGASLAEINLTSRSSGSGVITGKTFVADNAIDTYTSTFSVDVLWVKVR